VLPGGVRRGFIRFAALLGAAAVGAAMALWVIPAVAGEFGGQERAAAPSADIVLPGPIAERGRGSGLPPATGGDSPGRPDEADRPHLTALSGTLIRCGEEYCVNGIKVGFGPPWYVSGTDASTDYDDDGRVESLAQEIEGLVRTTVTLTVEYGRFGEADAFAIDGVFYRDEIGPPPWVSPPE
jgi:hypothetical protein